jgi:hypothetical protein
MNAKNAKDVKQNIDKVDGEREITSELTIEEQLELFAELLIDQYLKQILKNEKE